MGLPQTPSRGSVDGKTSRRVKGNGKQDIEVHVYLSQVWYDLLDYLDYSHS